jgi:hypothetical protein
MDDDDDDFTIEILKAGRFSLWYLASLVATHVGNISRVGAAFCDDVSQMFGGHEVYNRDRADMHEQGALEIEALTGGITIGSESESEAN